MVIITLYIVVRFMPGSKEKDIILKETGRVFDIHCTKAPR